VAPRLGGRIGQGGSAEVFAWDAGRVLKLFRPEYEYAVEREAECAGAVNRAGVACPAVHGVVEVDGRRGIVFERVDGPTLLDQLVRGERAAPELGRVLAAVHLAMHEVEVAGLPDLAAAVAAQGLAFPSGPIVFHGDFHPGNVIVGADGPSTIDWVNAHLAPRTADVTRTVMAVRYQALRGDQPEAALERERTARARILDAYLTAFVAAQPSMVDDLAFWLTQAAASLLRTEPQSADAGDLRALAGGRHREVEEPALRRLLPPA
jgi:aminoglycoside phosphotransferase (APT) family kinase protein